MIVEIRFNPQVYDSIFSIVLNNHNENIRIQILKINPKKKPKTVNFLLVYQKWKGKFYFRFGRINERLKGKIFLSDRLNNFFLAKKNLYSAKSRHKQNNETTILSNSGINLNIKRDPVQKTNK
ncbi:hypothetical protein BpHYR1_039377 [Brachionus plicatilis]|uniref:Uncharacterized protein n=1 Tax=Brachionus plicatilis TaxID=10195 RepID=A0A3M7SUL3_BRAPC|nr:hypothetical protein BpHYR1_039377 [Brachionus plicatilis]